MANDFTQSREMLKKHQTLHRYYQKQTKRNKNVALNKEEQDYILMDKKEADEAKRANMEQKRILKEERERQRIIEKLNEKDLRVQDGSDVSALTPHVLLTHSLFLV